MKNIYWFKVNLKNIYNLKNERFTYLTILYSFKSQ